MADRSLCPANLLLVLFAIFTIVAAQESTTSPFEGVFEDVASCSKDCDNTYPLHTYPEPNDLKACNRGCRLFAMLDFLEEVFTEEFNATVAECSNACGEAYTDPSALLACELGCSNQLPYSVEEHRKWADEATQVHYLIPMFSVRSLWQGLIDTARGMSYSYWSVYMQDENGQVYVFESPPEVDVFTLDPDAANARNWLNSDTNLQPAAFMPQLSPEEAIPDQPAALYSDPSDWLECVSRKSGLPQWLLSMTLFLSVLALIWLCCVTMVTAPDQRVSAPKLSIYGDLEYLKKGTVSPYPVLIQNMAGKKSSSARNGIDEDDDVEPLSIKIDIAAHQSLI